MEQAIRTKIVALLDQHRNMTLATLRPDGWPQATTVGYANDGLTLSFLCGLDSQKATGIRLHQTLQRFLKACGMGHDVAERDRLALSRLPRALV